HRALPGFLADHDRRDGQVVLRCGVQYAHAARLQICPRGRGHGRVAHGGHQRGRHSQSLCHHGGSGGRPAGGHVLALGGDLGVHRRWGCRPVDHVQGGQVHAEQFGVVLGCPRHQLSVTTYTTSEPEAMSVTSCATPLSWTSRPASALTLWSTCRPASVSRSWACPPESSAKTSTTDFTTPSELVLVAPRVGPSTIEIGRASGRERGGRQGGEVMR